MLEQRRSRVPTTFILNSFNKPSLTTQRLRLGLLHTRKNLIWQPTRTMKVKKSQPRRFSIPKPIIANIRNTRPKKQMSDAFTLINQWKLRSSRQHSKTRDSTLSNSTLCSIPLTLEQRTNNLRKLQSSPQLMRHLTNSDRQDLKTKHLSRSLP